MIIPNEPLANESQPLLDVKRNHLLFMEIMRRTIEKQDLFENLQETVLNITQYLRFQSNFFSDKDLP